MSTQIWSRVEHALNRRDALNSEVRLITRFYGNIVCSMYMYTEFYIIIFTSIVKNELWTKVAKAYCKSLTREVPDSKLKVHAYEQ